MRTTRRRLLARSVASVAILLAPSANADYGSKAVHQVEVSSSPPGFGVWL